MNVIKWTLINACSIVMMACNFAEGQDISDVNHIILVGQSLGAAEHSLPIVTDSPTGYGNLRFKIGTHTWKRGYLENQPERRDSTLFAFVPLTAVERGHEGETIGNGLCDHLKSSTSGFSKKDFSFLFSFTGEGSRLIRELDKVHDDAKDPRAAERQNKGGYYATILDDVKRAKLICDTLHKTYSVMAITWMQGESNRLGHITRWDKPLENKKDFMELYVKDLIQLKNDLQKDIRALTMQKKNIPFFTYQTAGANIGTAQLMACDREKDMYMVGATYMMPNARNSRVWGTQEHGDPIHLSADGERWLGEMFAKVLRKVIFEKKEWTPLRPLSATLKDPKHIIVKFNVPEPPLTLDTLFLPKQGSSCGFSVYNKTKTVNVIKASVIGQDAVELVLGDALEDVSSYFISYGLDTYSRDLSAKIIGIGVKDSVINGVPHISIEFAGNIVNEFNVISAEGNFMLVNKNIEYKDLTTAIIRKVFLNQKGNTVVIGERKDLRNNLPFKVGQNCYVQREYGYGNLRDSDPEKSIFTFTDKQYGNRQAQHYPLYNWCIVFDDLILNKEEVKQ